MDKSLFYFYKENHVDGGELNEQVLTGELLYNEDAALSSSQGAKRKILVITKYKQQQQ